MSESDGIVSRSRLIVADMDIGIDDALALFILLKATQSADGPGAAVPTKVLAITCVSGNTDVDNVARNTLRVLRAAKRNDIPVHRGATSALIADQLAAGHDPYHGHDGLGDLMAANGELRDEAAIRDEHAVNALHRLVSEEHPDGQVTLLCTGPLTNIALAIRMYGDRFVRNVRDVFIMGGNHQGVGNVRHRIGAEFNFYADPEAAWIVLDGFGRAGVPLTLLPWETCTDERFPLPWTWRMDVWGAIRSPVTQFMNPIDAWMQQKHKSQWYNHCDALLAAALLFPECCVRRESRRLCTVELQGTHTRGALVVNHASESIGQWVRIIEAIDVDAFKAVMLWTAKSE